MLYLYAAAAKSLQLCPALCNSIDGSPPGSSVPGILQARTLEWVAISFSFVSIWDDRYSLGLLWNHFVTYVSQIIMLHTLNLYSTQCQYYLNKTGRR